MHATSMRPRRSVQGACLLGLFALLFVRQLCWVGPNTSSSTRSDGVRRLRTSRRAAEPQRWQKGLDVALLDVDATSEQRWQGLIDALSSPGDIAESVVQAGQAIAEKGLREGSPEAIDKIFPRGTIARSDIEGLIALARQAPEVAESLQSIRSRRSVTERSDSQPSPPDLQSLASGFQTILSTEKREEVVEELRNSLRSTPSNLEEPAYEVIFEADDFEVRRYEPFTVSAYRMEPQPGDGSFNAVGFNTLASYLFGDNEDDRPMKMTMPVETSYMGEEDRTMSFVMPADEVEVGLPKPRTSEVELRSIPSRLVAVRRFPGIATDTEVKRQVEKLVEAVKAEDSYVVLNEEEYSVLQYNPPYTIPWRRRNEIALVVVPAQRESSLMSPLTSPESLLRAAMKRDEAA